MSPLSREELSVLAAKPEGWAVSIFMPTQRAGAEVQQNRIRLKNLLTKAEERLVEGGLRRPKAQELLQPAQKLLEDEPFWQHQSDGLAAFISPDVFRTYRVPLILEELVSLGEYFQIKPLLPLISGDGCFYVLAISQNRVRLLEGTRESICEANLRGEPTSLAQALKYDEFEPVMQYHSTGVAGLKGRGPIEMHGQGGVEEFHKTELLRYFQEVNRGLEDYFATKQAPLVLAGVDYLLPIYREASTYAYLLEEGIEGNPDDLKAKELHKKAWALVQPLFDAVRREAVAKYQELEGTGLTSRQVEEIVPAAYDGRVEILFVARDRHQYGLFDPATNAVYLQGESQPGNEDLLDFAAAHTFLNSGTVYAVESGGVPGGGSAAATFRY